MNTQFNQYLNGGNSKYWRLKLNAWWDGGPSYSAYYSYWCGIDVNNGQDYTCDEVDSYAPRYWGRHKYASSTKSDRSFETSHRFAAVGSKRPFPMVRSTVKWPTYGVTYLVNYRGWDIAYSSTSNTWKLTQDAKY